MITIKTALWSTTLPDDHLRIGISHGVPRFRVAPGWRRYTLLNPGPWLTAPDFTERYQTEILDRLDPQRVHDELIALAVGRVAVLCCFEKAGGPPVVPSGASGLVAGRGPRHRGAGIWLRDADARPTPAAPAGAWCYAAPMSDLYDTDVTLWAEQQADLLRRVAAGERINDQVDWDNVIEEVETVGRSERDTVLALLTNILDHKLRIIGWPDHPAVSHWQHELRPWLARVAKRHRASMHIGDEMADLFRIARLDTDAHMLDAGPPAAPLPASCPWTLDELLAEAAAALHWQPE